MDRLAISDISTSIPLEAKTPMLQFIKDTALEQGFVPYELICRPEDVPMKVKELSNAGARVMVGAVGTKGMSWTTEWMEKNRLMKDYKKPSDPLETQKSSCVPFALRTLGFSVDSETSDAVAHGYDESVKSGQNYHGHVLAIKPIESGYEVTDQHGSGAISEETLILMAQFRAKKVAGDFNSGYFFLEAKKLETHGG